MGSEDAYGLYEAADAMRPYYPNKSLDELRKFAADVLRELLAEGLIILCREDRGSGSRDDPCQTVSIHFEEIERVLAEKASWQPFGPENPPGVAFYASEKGVHEYHLL